MILYNVQQKDGCRFNIESDYTPAEMAKEYLTLGTGLAHLWSDLDGQWVWTYSYLNPPTDNP